MKLLNELRAIMDQEKMVTIYGDDSDHDNYYVGYIQAVNESGLLLSKQNYGGFPNGFVFFTDILFFQTDTLDTRRHEKLYQLIGIEPKSFPLDSGKDLLEQLLTIIFEEKLFCDFFKKENDEGDVLGFISEYHEDYIVVTCVDKYGEYFGRTYLEKADIFRIYIEGEYEKSIRLLYENSKLFK